MTTNHPIYFSVIIPVYNSENHLVKCLNSILSQNFPDFELLLINDGSVDHSGQICDQYAKDNDNVRVFHRKNGGASSARNYGIEHAQGKYLCFIDSDDWVDPNYLSNFYKKVVSEKEFIIANFIRVENDSSTKIWDVNDDTVWVDDINDLILKFNIVRNGFTVAKLYSTAIVKQHSIRFPENVHYAEDCIFMLQYLKHINRIRFIGAAIGYYYINHYSGTLSKKYNLFSEELNCLQLIQRYLRALNTSQPFNKESSRYLNGWLQNYYLRVLQSIYRADNKLPVNAKINMLKKARMEFNEEVFKDFQKSSTSALGRLTLKLYHTRLYYIFNLYMETLYGNIGKKIKTFMSTVTP